MKAFLMYKDQDFDLKRPLPSNAGALMQDLELATLLNAMAFGDTFLGEVAKAAILTSLSNDPGTILYRQDILKDCLKNPFIVTEIYHIAVGALERRRRGYWTPLIHDYPSGILHNSIDVLRMLMTQLKRLRNIADHHTPRFESAGFTRLFATLRSELAEDYFATIQDHLQQLKFRGGVLISAQLGKGNKATNYALRKSEQNDKLWLLRFLVRKPEVYTYFLHPRDESGAKALSQLNDQGVNLVANALAQSTDHIQSFFNMLRTELAFYMGCLNLHARLAQKGEPVCFPVPAASTGRRHSSSGLYDVCLSLNMGKRVVGNAVNADDKDLVIITGANQGGKSTFLRSIGLSQLMMQSGMFAPAESFSSNVCDRLFTHYKREEDATLKSGKLAEELGRMSEIVDHMTPNSMVLFNESFAATNEREGSEIATQITSALLEKRIKIFFVTHLYEFAHGLFDRKMKGAVFLRAERQTDGSRTFRLVEGEPLQTSYGQDLYKVIFERGNDAPKPLSSVTETES